MNPHDITPWGPDWVWSLPLIAVTVMFHVTGLGALRRVADRLRPHVFRYPGSSVAAATLVIAVLHSCEGILWAAVYNWLGALANMREAILYSLNALTAYGHTPLTLEMKWQLMGSLEALNGWILFGLSAAFLFNLLQDVWEQLARASRLRGGARSTA